MLLVRISRLDADANFLFPRNSKMLTRFMMDETYGQCKPLTAGWAQRGLLDATADSDFFGRLAYYEEARSKGTPRGAIFVAERDDGKLCGFADVSASLWLPNDQAFRLPEGDDLQRLAQTGIGRDGQPKPGVELRPYLSNLVVDASLRRQAVGRKLVAACEEEAKTFRVTADAPTLSGDLWLEVTTSNAAALAFYERLGYTRAGDTAGNEVERVAGSFRIAEVKRNVMRKVLRLKGGLSALPLTSSAAARRTLTAPRLAPSGAARLHPPASPQGLGREAGSHTQVAGHTLKALGEHQRRRLHISLKKALGEHPYGSASAPAVVQSPPSPCPSRGGEGAAREQRRGGRDCGIRGGEGVLGGRGLFYRRRGGDPGQGCRGGREGGVLSPSCGRVYSALRFENFHPDPALPKCGLLLVSTWPKR